MVIKKKLMQIGGLVIAMAALMNFTSCLRALNKTNAGDIERLLQEKYGIEFQVISIGNRLASPSMDTVTAYCSPKNNNRVVFEAKMNTNNELVSDNFPNRVIDVQAEDYIENYFHKYGFSVSANVHIFQLTDDIDFRTANYLQILKNTPDVGFSIYVAVCETDDTRKLYEVLSSLLTSYYRHNKSIHIGMDLWHMSVESYKTCEEELQGIPSPSEYIYIKHSPIGSASILMTNGTLNVSYEEFNKKFRSR